MDKTKELYISDTEEKAQKALDTVDAFINHQGLSGKRAIHLRLLAEETIGMVKAMTGDYQALFWMEHEDGEYRVKLLAKTKMNLEKKEELLSVATSKKNAAAKGFMGKIGDIIENGLLNFDEVMSLQQEYGGGAADFTMCGMGAPGELPPMGDPLIWSLSNYKDALDEADDEEDDVKEANDELEKSIVASLAKDVIVGVKKDSVDMTIIWS
ncbi:MULTISPECIES: hypothetical protein [unclassified Butyrivibrio]|uniref:hypothetical protein n=1 Tax=unclassified Butyrivibrio TaxID=2639466 RepID=UPI0003B6ACB1|nr:MULTISPECIES: hypothetical protein [unclassified Butyrivibrio]SEL50518.1 hypothetical protein SAMN04487770_11169 [Butyrivibrio sp. ob235]